MPAGLYLGDRAYCRVLSTNRCAPIAMGTNLGSASVTGIYLQVSPLGGPETVQFCSHRNDGTVVQVRDLRGSDTTIADIHRLTTHPAAVTVQEDVDRRRRPKLLAFPPLITAPLCNVIDLKLANRSGIRTGENVKPNAAGGDRCKDVDLLMPDRFRGGYGFPLNSIPHID